MKRICLLLLLFVVGIASGDAQQVGGFNSVTATGSTTGVALADRFAEIVNVKDYGAKGDGATDDSTAISAAVARVNTLANNGSSGTPIALYFPAGIYKVAAASITQFAGGVNGSVIGDGSHKSYVKVTTAYSGDVFSWSEAWMANDYNGTSLNPANDKAGPLVSGITVTGDNTATNVANAFMFYDRDDLVRFDDVGIFFMHGQCLAVGKTKNTAFGYMRESRFYDVRCWNSGTTSVPTIEVDTSGAGDSTNQLSFFGLDVFAPASVGILLHNSGNSGKAPGNFRFYGLRVEGALSGGQSGDLLQIGTSSDPNTSPSPGTIQVFGFVGNASYSGSCTISFNGQTIATGAAFQPHLITIQGMITSGTGKGICINQGYDIDITMPLLATTDTNLVIASNANVTKEINLNFSGRESTLSTSIDSTSLGNTFWANQIVATGNPASNSPSAIAFPRSSGNSLSGTANVISGGISNNSQGTGNVVAGGQSNTVSGQFSTIVGGLRANDRGLYGGLCKASGFFAAQGDAQGCDYVLRGTTANTSAVTLTTDGGAASSTNCIDIPTLTGYSLNIDIEAFDHSAVANNEAWIGWAGKMHRPSSAATTTVVMASAPTPLTSGTVTGSSVAATADTTNGCLNLSFTPPTGNADTWRVVARVHTTQVQ